MYGKKWIRRAKIKSSGFTLIELMAVMIILGLLAGVVTIGITRQMDKAKVNTAKTQISQLEQALSIHQLDCGFYPSSMDGLISEGGSGRTCKGWNGPYLKKKQIPDDPWGTPYHFASPGVHNADSYDLWSDGMDGEEGTSDDITSWSSEVQEE